MSEGDPFGIPETGLNRVAGDRTLKLAEQTGEWLSLLTGDRSGSKARLRPRKKTANDAIVLANRTCDVSIHWRDGTPDRALKTTGPYPLTSGNSRKSAAAIQVQIKQSADKAHQVLDITLPENLSPGRFACIMTSDRGVEGYFSIDVD